MSTGAHRCLGKAGKLMEMHPSDLSGEELAKLEPPLPPSKQGGRPRAMEMRGVHLQAQYKDFRRGLVLSSHS